MSELHILQEWERYQERVMDPASPPLQVVEMRRAFYAGAWSFFGILLGKTNQGDEPTPLDLALMDDLDRELREFLKDVAEGRK